MENPRLEPVERMLAERACERLLVELVHRLDLGEPSTVAELFTPDGVWEWPDGDRLVVGREALAAYFGGRPADRLSRRLVTNVRVDVDTPDTAGATSYLTTFRVDGHRGGLVPAGPPVQVGHYRDTFERRDGDWLLARRTLHLAFGSATPRAS